MTALAGNHAAVYAAAPLSATITDVAFTDSGDHTTYVISDATKRYFDDTATFVIQESTDTGSTWHAAPATFSIQYVGGKIIYASARNATYQYRVHSGMYLTITQIGEGHEWDLNLQANLANATVFGDDWQRNVVTTKKATADIKKFWGDNYFFGLLSSGTRIVVSLYVSTDTNARYEFFSNIGKIDIKTPVAALVESDVSIEATGQVYYSPS